jgi:biotin carboxyl carrier protein
MTNASRAVRVTASPATAQPDEQPQVIAAGTAVPGRHQIHVGRVGAIDIDGRHTVEVVVDGWRFELVVEDETRAVLRERASRVRGAVAGGGGPLEIRAIIPGRVASVAVNPGDLVEAGQTLLAVEAMKMQNELRAPRSGTVARIPATAGATVELGDVLVVLE